VFSSKTLLKSFLLLFLITTVHNKSEAGVGNVVGGVIQSAKSLGTTVSGMGTKMFQGSARLTRQAAKVFSKQIVALTLMGKYVCATSYAFGKQALLDVSEKTVAMLLATCNKLYFCASTIASTAFCNKFVVTLVHNLMHSVSHLLRTAIRYVSSVANYSKYAAQQLFENLLVPIVQFAITCGDFALKTIKISLELLCNYLIAPLLDFVFACKEFAVRAVGVTLNAIGTYCITPVLNFIISCRDFAVKCVDFVLESIALYLIAPVLRFATACKEFAPRCLKRVLEGIFEYVIVPVLRFACDCGEFVFRCMGTVIEKAFEYIMIPILNTIGKLLRGFCTLLEKSFTNIIIPIIDKTFEHVLFPLLRLMGKLTYYACIALEKVIFNILVPLFDLLATCIDKSVEFVEYIKRTFYQVFANLIDDAIIPILQFIVRGSHKVLKATYYTFLFAIGFFPYIIHKTYKAIFKRKKGGSAKFA